ncbi:unnamed protein product [Brugia timori]|uniref:Ovule protein n=1 Tax=Brugia timori TaxID=42155 RepID=A0A0R3QLT2_9BILA|nr:unnamed protein product [Brugia timori]
MEVEQIHSNTKRPPSTLSSSCRLTVKGMYRQYLGSKSKALPESFAQSQPLLPCREINMMLSPMNYSANSFMGVKV